MADPQPRYVLTPEGHRKTVSNGKVFMNLNAGVEQRITPGGVKVCMYTKRPGVYYTIKGEPVPESTAARAGFPVEALRKKREFLSDQAKAQAALQGALREGGAGKQLQQQRGPYALYLLGSGLGVLEKDGEQLAPPMPYAVALEEFADFTSGLPEDEEAAEGPLVFPAKETGDARREA